jgi:S1-C subfamily serine protease
MYLLLMSLLLSSAQAAESDAAVKIARLGVVASTPTYAERQQVDIPNGGVIVREILNTGPAFRAGLRPGDFIVAYNQVVIDSLQHFSDLVSEEMPTAKAVPMLVLRDENEYVALAVHLE